MVIRHNFRLILLVVIFREIKDNMEISAGIGITFFKVANLERAI